MCANYDKDYILGKFMYCVKWTYNLHKGVSCCYKGPLNIITVKRHIISPHLCYQYALIEVKPGLNVIIKA